MALAQAILGIVMLLLAALCTNRAGANAAVGNTKWARISMIGAVCGIISGVMLIMGPFIYPV
jgi:hypothetical protein